MRFIMNDHMGLTTGYRIFWDNLRLSCLDKGFKLPLYPIGCMVPRIIWGLLPFLSFAAAVDQRKSIYGSSNFVVSWQNIFYLLRREVEIFQKKNHKNIFFFFLEHYTNVPFTIIISKISILAAHFIRWAKPFCFIRYGQWAIQTL